MTPDPYRNAYEKALADLTVIADRFEQLRTRKKSVENLIAALQPIFISAQQAPPEATAISQVEMQHIQQNSSQETEEVASEPAGSYSFLDVPAPLPESDGDPFERRTKASFRFKGLSVQRSF